MIKKLSIAAAIVAALLFAAVLYIKRSTGPSDAAALVPAEAIFFANLPDLPRTAMRWHDTALAKIGREPDVKAFLEKPLGRFFSQPGSQEASSLLMALKPGNIYLAISDLTPSRADVIVGFQYWGGRPAYDQAVARLRQEIPGTKGAPTTESHNGVEILITTHDASSLFSASVGRWGFVSTSGTLLKDTLDRVTGKLKTASLASSPRFADVTGRLSKSPDLLFFLQPEKAFDTLLAIGQTLGAQTIPDQINSLRATEAVGGIWKLDGAAQRDEVFFQRTTPQSVSTLQHATLSLTSPETFAFLDFALRTESLPSLIANLTPALSDTPEAFALARLAAEAYGPEFGLIANWPAGQATPGGVLALQIRDKEKSALFLQQMLALLPDHTTSTQEGVTLYGFPTLGNALASPTLAQTEAFLIAGIDSGTILTLANKPAASPTLAAAPRFSGELKTFQNSNEAFAFVDTATLFERAYTTLRPVLIFGASVMPGISASIDTGKLPATESITKHLPPLVFSQRVESGGTLISSSGPFTVNQLALAAALSAALNRPAIP